MVAYAYGLSEMLQCYHWYNSTVGIILLFYFGMFLILLICYFEITLNISEFVTVSQ